MPDIRIKDLTTTASTTAADDFFAADGTTNGTRKLSAYSPTFGGNATVGGTLTVSGTGTSTFAGGVTIRRDQAALTGLIVDNRNGGGTSDLILSEDGGSSNYFRIYRSGSTTGTPNVVNISNIVGGSATTTAIEFGSPLKATATTASTSTSTGALVVGNGSSGGLGVGGNASIGGTVFFGTGSDVQASRAGAGVLDVRHPSNTTSRLDVTGATSAGLGLRQSGTRDWFVSAESNELRTSCLTANSVASYESGVLVRVRDTTASTGTSSGALVVSGGVGVAKRIYSGEGLDTAGDNATHINFVRNGTISIGPTSAATPKLQVGGGLLLANNSQSVPAYGDVGPQLSVAGAVITDTTSSGTVSRAVVNSIAASALAASSTTTYTQAASLFVAGAPTANANVTITNAYAIYTAGGRINFQGLPTSSAGLQAGTLWNDAGTLKVA